MPSRRTAWVKAMLLAALALMFAVKINSGTLTYYINQRFAWLALVAVLLFAAMALTAAYRLMTRTTVESPLGAAHGRVSALGIGLVALPALLGLLVPARPLGASAVAGRDLSLGAPARAGAVAVAPRGGGSRTIIDWLIEMGRNPDPSALNGQSADVVGFVYRDARLAADQLYVARFTLSCCVADAAPVALLVQSSDAAALKNDAWIRVTGRFAAGAAGGTPAPVLVAERIDAVEPPAQPYLLP